jgi:hypothetical protein
LAWAPALAALSVIGWAVTTAADIDVSKQFTLFGASGAPCVKMILAVTAMLRGDAEDQLGSRRCGVPCQPAHRVVVLQSVPGGGVDAGEIDIGAGAQAELQPGPPQDAVRPPPAQVLEPTLVKARRDPAGKEPLDQGRRVRGPEPKQNLQRRRGQRPARRRAQARPVDQDEPSVLGLEQPASPAAEAVERVRGGSASRSPGR